MSKSYDNSPNIIEKKNLILCEGKDEYYFLLNLIDFYLRKDPQKYEVLDTYKIIDFGGNDQLTNFLGTLKLVSGFSKVKTICIVRDAEKDGRAAFQSVQSSLKKNGFSSPKSIYKNTRGMDFYGVQNQTIGVLFFPFMVDQNGNPVSGTLEDLCLHILKKNCDPQDLLELCSRYVFGINTKRVREFKKIHKNRIHVFLASTDECVDMKVGEAAKTGIYDLDDEIVKNAVNYLVNLAV